MEGGFRAWQGLVAEGPPEAGMAYFRQAVGTDEIIGLAWKLEDGTRIFYSGLADVIEDGDTVKLLRELVSAEERHKSVLIGLYKDFFGVEAGTDFPHANITADSREDIMEGGISVEEALKWAVGKGIESILEFAVALETNSYDLYLKMERAIGDERAEKIFSTLASDERNHLDRLASLLEKKI
jgi:rubrerythrin